MAWWRSPEDTQPAKGFIGENFGGNHIREVLPVKRTASMTTKWRHPALIVRIYDDADETWTLTEGEWSN